MVIKNYLFLSVVTMFLPSLSLSADIHGNLVAVDSMGVEKPINGVNISVVGYGAQDSTKNLGNFRISIPGSLANKPGQKIKLSINRPGYSILSPYNGIMFLPNDLKNEKIVVRIVPYLLNFYPTIYAVDTGNVRIQKFYVQTFATRSLKRAKELSNKLIHKGFKASYHPIDKTGQFKIIVGPFNSENSAKVKKNELIQKFSFSKSSYIFDKF